MSAVCSGVKGGGLAVGGGGGEEIPGHPRHVSLSQIRPTPVLFVPLTVN